MPRIPVVSEESVTPRGPVQARVDTSQSAAELGGVQVERAGKIGEAVQTVGDVFERIQLKKDERDAFEAEAATKKFAIDQQNEIRQRTNRDAEGSTQRAAGAFNKHMEEVEKKLTGRARQMYRERAQPVLLGLTAFASQHEITQLDNAKRTAAEAAKHMDTELAVNNVYNPAARAGALASVKAKQDEINKSQGILPDRDKDTYDAKMLGATTEFHTAVIAALSDNPTLAAAYFKDHKTEILSDKRGSIEESIEKDKHRVDAQRFADSVEARGLTYEKGLVELKKKFEGAARTVAEQELDNLFAKRKVAEKDREESAAKRGYESLRATGSYASISGSDLTAMGPKNADALLAIARGHNVTTDFAVYDSVLRQLLATPKLEDRQKVNLLQYASSISQSDMQRLQGIQFGVGSYAAPSFDSAVTLQQILAAKHKENKMKKAEQGEFDAYVYNTVAARERLLGRKLQPPEIEEVVKGALREVSTAGWFGLQTTKPAFRVDVPDEKRAEIEAALRRGGVAVTEDNVVQLYSDMQKDGE